MKKHPIDAISLIAISFGFLYANLSAQPHLHIERDLEALRLDGNQSWLSFYDGPSYEGFLWNNQGTITLGTSHLNPTGDLKFVLNNAERMTFRPNGNIGVGISNPLAPFQIHHDGEALRLSGGQPYLSFYNGIGGYAGYLWNKDLFHMELGTALGNTTGVLTLKANNNLGIWIDPDGSVGIKTAPSSGFPFEVNGTARFFGINIGQNWGAFAGVNFEFRQNQQLIGYLSPSSGWEHVSDRKLKRNIEPFRSGILNDIKSLTACTYEYNFLTQDEQSIGFVAQDVMKTFPELVSRYLSDEGEETLSIAYGKVAVIAIKAIQEQQEILEKLLIENRELHERINRLEENHSFKAKRIKQ